MGVVYLAEDLRLGRTVALKAVAPQFTGDASRRERLRREARAVASLSHSGIATVYALEEFEGQMFIAGEFVPGETLREEIARGPLSVPAAIESAMALATALAAAHDRGIVHRDLKPENVIRTPTGQMKILDFGVARVLAGEGDGNLTADGTFVGTPAYTSPEQIRGQPVDQRSDLFSLGVIIYELVAGVRPFSGADAPSTIAKILEAEPRRLTEQPGADQTDRVALGALEQVVRACLQKVPGARYQSAHELVHALDLVRSGLPSAVRLPGAGRGSPAVPPLWWWQFHQAAASAAYLALLIPLWMTQPWIRSRLGLILLLVGLASAVAAVILRLHLWFTVRSYPAEWAIQRAHSARWIIAADLIFVGTLAVAAAAIFEEHAAMAALLIGAAVAVLVSSAIIEPATTRAAFGRDDASRTRPTTD